MTIDVRDYQLSGANKNLIEAKKQKLKLMKQNSERNYKILKINNGYFIYSRLKKQILVEVVG